jgi:excisionase family DNA binding protein
MHEVKPPARQAGPAAAQQHPELGPMLPSLKSVFEDVLRPLKAELEFIRATLQARRKDHYTVEEVARLTGRSAYTVRRWVALGRIRAIRISGTGPKGRLLIPREELDTLIAAGLGARVPDAAAD